MEASMIQRTFSFALLFLASFSPPALAQRRA
jgi:hypothetical protein